MGMELVRHLVVLMLENRSFDNMVGYVYAADENCPPINIPPPAEGSPTTYDGLRKPAPDTDFWNPSNADFFGNPSAAPDTIPATQAVTDFRMPISDPGEGFVHMTSQLFGPKVTSPTQSDLHQMKGFALDYVSCGMIRYHPTSASAAVWRRFINRELPDRRAGDNFEKPRATILRALSEISRPRARSRATTTWACRTHSSI